MSRKGVTAGLLCLAAGVAACRPSPAAQAAPLLNGSSPSTGAGATSPVAGTLNNTVSNAAIVKTALKYLGYPYTTVGRTPSEGFSCIGFASYVYQSNGIDLPDDLNLALKYAPSISRSDLLPGDLIFFQNTVWPGVSHVAIYLGNNKIVHAEWYNRGVVISTLTDDPVDGNYWIGKYLGASRPWGGPAQSVKVTLGPSGPTKYATPTATPLPVPSGANATVDVAALNVRASPSLQAQVKEVIDQGTRVQVTGTKGDWSHVVIGDGTVGWVISSAIQSDGSGDTPAPAATPTPVLATPVPTATPSPTPAATAPTPTAPAWTAVVSAAALRLRANPSLDAAVVTVLNHGARVTVLSVSKDWVHVRAASGQTGWVSAQYVKVGAKPAVTHRIVSAVRVHNAPSLKAPVLLVAHAGTPVDLLRSAGDWALVHLRHGPTGYVASQYVK